MKTSITAIESASWHTPLVLRGNPVDCIRQAAEIGYEGIELHLMDSSAVDQKAILQALQKYQISLTSIGTGSSYSQQRVFLTSDSAEVRGEAIRRMLEHIRFASVTGAVVIIGLMKGQKKDGSSEQAYEEYFDIGIQACLQEAEHLGVTLAFEVIDRFESDWLNTIEEGMQLMERYPSEYLTLHLDTFHMNIEEANLADAIRKAGSKVGHVHVADSDRWYPGHAHYDFASTFAALKEIGYQGAITLESFLYPDPDTAARLALQTIKRYIG